ncbi:MAG: hypothetical protein JSU58_02950 [Dehalococcoidales bacterium]|nr:MAG: hypothetical protein JSU58_02950 [Dehalococcoidales bacterium]
MSTNDTNNLIEPAFFLIDILISVALLLWVRLNEKVMEDSIAGSCMKHLKKIVACLSAVILTSAVIILPAPVHAAGEIINLDVNIGSIGQQVNISGSGFDPGSPADRSVNIIFGKYPGTVVNYSIGVYEIVKVQPLNTDGTFSTSFNVPQVLGGGVIEEVTQGTYYIFLTYHIPPSTNTLTILQIAAFNVLAGAITITPATGSPGTELSISGQEFGAIEEIIIKYDEEAIPIFQGDRSTDGSGSFQNTRILVPPSPAGVHAVTVIGKTSSHQAGRPFTVEPVLNIQPTPGAASSKITIGGNGFGAGANINVTFDNNSVYSGTTDLKGSFVSTLPAGTFSEGTYLVTASDTAGNSAQISYDILDASVMLEPSEGSPGWEVSISGAGFRPDKTITIGFEDASGNDISVKSDDEGNFSTIFTVPWSNVGNWEVDVSDGHTTKTVEFKVNTSGLIDPITNESFPGYAGTGIGIAGQGFIAGRTVTVTFSGTQVATGTVESNGTFNIPFYAPSASSGHHIIEATDGTNVIKYGFVMENTPPTKTRLLLPESGTKADAEAFFDWEDVTDDSGITYTLQIATDADFSYITLEKEGIEVSEFTIAPQNKLIAVTPEAPYYWRVRAVDKAFNEAEWSEPATFHVGFGMNMPQSVIYIIIVGVALLLAVFTFWLGRKTAYY